MEKLVRQSVIGLKFQAQGCLAPSPELSVPTSTPSKEMRSEKVISWRTS